jgi:predicted  nucleic acid-binding Zn-ribbon protein
MLFMTAASPCSKDMQKVTTFEFDFALLRAILGMYQLSEHIVEISINLNLPQTHQLSLLDVDESPEDTQNITQLAIQAIKSYLEMHEAAIGVCLNLYLCKESFKKSGDKGWSAFCTKNFKQYGLSLPHIRACVQAGRAFHLHQQRVGEKATYDIQILQKLSMSALEVVGSAPDEVKSQAIERLVDKTQKADQTPTAKETVSVVNELKAELAAANQTSAEKDASNARLSTKLRDNDTRIAELVEKLNRTEIALQQARQQKVEVVEADPNSNIVRKQIENLHAELQDLQRDIDQAKGQKQELLDQLAGYSRRSKMVELAEDNFKELSNSIQMIKARWTDVYISSLRKELPSEYEDKLHKFSQDLRKIADLLSPDMLTMEGG